MDNKYAEFTNGFINKALTASFGESSSTLNVSFKKTVLIRDYETEVIEASSTVTIDKPLTGAERTFITAIIRTQLEYEAYCNLLLKGMVTEKQFNDRKLALASELNSLKEKAEQLIGKSLDSYFEIQA